MSLLTEEEIFAAALQKAPAERAAFLDRACQEDLQLRAAVEALLKAHDHPDSFLEHPLGEVTIDQPLTEKPGSVIGPYKLLQQIGEGGFGVVYMAEQVEPVRRRVALKVIKPGMDTRQVIARFEAERQALAVMDHPNIARVLDAGATESGRPFFVMELVRGVPITTYCDENNLPIRERLTLFATVCQAIQHAHTKGIIHRDIKPTNVLVTRQDGQPVVKVIDFGVAKAMGQQLTDKTLFTDFAQMIGTPLYMSPEQAELSSTDIDTRSDIYSLGVLLYELLTGTTPVSKEQLKQAAFDEIRRIIREEEPPKPSTRISSAEAAPSIAAQRHTEPAKLARLVRGELDWIVMKALEKDRSRRYETATGFAADIQHYLNDEAVVACPPSAAYRFRKFARRNKGGLAVAGLVLFFLVLLGSGVGWAVRDRAARAQEAAREKAARQAAMEHEIERALDESAQFQAQGKIAEALATARRGEGLLAGGAGEQVTERVKSRVADLSLAATVEEIRARRSVFARDYESLAVEQEYADAFRHFRLEEKGVLPAEAAQRLRATSVAVELAAALDDWALTRFGRAGYQRLLAVARAADTSDPARDRLRELLIQPEIQGSQLKEQASLLKVENLRPPTLCFLVQALGSRGISGGEETIALLREAQRRYPGDFSVNLHLASNLHNSGKANEAIRFYTAALALRPQSGARIGLGRALQENGELNAALVQLREAVRLYPEQWMAYTALGSALIDAGDQEAGLAAYQEAFRLAPKNPLPPLYLGVKLKEKRQWGEAIAEFRKVIELDPKSKGAADAYFRIGKALEEQGKLEETIASFRKAAELDSDLVLAHRCLAWLLTTCREAKLRDTSGGLEAARKAVAAGSQSPLAWQVLGWAHYRAGDWKASIEALENSCALERGGDAFQWIFLAMAHWQLGQKDKAREWYDRSVEWMDKNQRTDELLRRFRAEAEELMN
jgi:serine/threonine protein kinase/tetratricopeptide (TPR) repeat protein